MGDPEVRRGHHLRMRHAEKGWERNGRRNRKNNCEDLCSWMMRRWGKEEWRGEVTVLNI